MERKVLVTAAQLRAMVSSDAARSMEMDSNKPASSKPRVLETDELFRSPNPIRWLHDYIAEMLAAAERVHDANSQAARDEAMERWAKTRLRLGLPRSPVPDTCDWVSICVAYCVQNSQLKDNTETILIEAGNAASELAMLNPISVVCVDTQGQIAWRQFERQVDFLVRVRNAVLIGLRRLLARLGEVHPPKAVPQARDPKSSLVQHSEVRSSTQLGELASAENTLRTAELERNSQPICDSFALAEERSAAGSVRSRQTKHRKRASRMANIEALTKAVEEHLVSARDYAFTTLKQTGTARLLERPKQKLLAKQLGMSESDASKCFSDKSAKWLRLCWDSASNLELIMRWNRSDRDEDAA